MEKSLLTVFHLFSIICVISVCIYFICIVYIQNGIISLILANKNSGVDLMSIGKYSIDDFYILFLTKIKLSIAYDANENIFILSWLMTLQIF